MIDNGVGLNTRALLLLIPFQYGTESGEAILKCILLYSVKHFPPFSTLNELLCIVYMIGIEHKAMLCRSCGWGTVWGGGKEKKQHFL